MNVQEKRLATDTKLELAILAIHTTTSNILQLILAHT